MLRSQRRFLENYFLSSLWFVRKLIEAGETKFQFHFKTSKEANKVSEEHLELRPQLDTEVCP